MKPTVVLIIDDDIDDRDFLKEAISEYDKDVVFRECKNGVEAVDTLTKDHKPAPDFIFLDLNMPLMNGRQCLSQLSEMDYLTGTPVIIYTTSAKPEEDEDLTGPGPVHFVTKPSRLAELRNYVRNILNRNWHLVTQL